MAEADVYAQGVLCCLATQHLCCLLIPFRAPREQNTGGLGMAGAFGLVAAFAVFFFWIRAGGNPHVVETVIGLVFALVARWSR